VGYQISNGGYQGTMEATAKGAVEIGVPVTGVTCDIFGSKRPNSFINNELRTRDYKYRLERLVELGDAYVVLPGSTGTLLELAMVWELFNKGFIAPKPVIFLAYFWKPVIDTILNSGETDAACIYIAKDIQHVVGYLQTKLTSVSK